MNNREINLKNNEGAPVAWCPIPWSHISIKSSGSYQVCCHAGSSASKGTIRDKDDVPYHISSATFDEVVNNDLMKSVRKDMLEGKWADTCTRCKREYDSGMNSRNLYERSTLADMVEPANYASYQKTLALTAPDGSITNTDFPVSFLDIRFGNLCNLKCVMCSPLDSNQWYDDYVDIWGYKNFTLDTGEKVKLIKNINDKFKPTNNIFDWSNDPNLWNQIEQHISQFRKIYIVGGEPLIIDAHYEFLQKCVDAGLANNITVEYNTNITSIPPRAWAIWKHFKNVVIGASIDGIGPVNDLIRYPSKWWKIEENLNKFIHASGNFIIHVAFTVQILNIWHFTDFINYLIIQNRPINEYWKSSPLMLSAHPVHRPAYLNINILPDSFKKEIEQHYLDYMAKIRTTDYQALYGDSKGASWEDKIVHGCKIIETYIKFMYQIQYSPEELKLHRKDCIHYLDKLDTLRNTNWKETCPELYAATLPWRELV